MKKEFTVKPVSGYLALLIAILFLGGAIAGFIYRIIWLGVTSLSAFLFYNFWDLRLLIRTAPVLWCFLVHTKVRSGKMDFSG